MQKIKVGFLGCGNIGGGTWQLLQDMHEDFVRNFSIDFEVKKMLVRALDEKRAVEVPCSLLTTDVNEILSDPDISLVCEFMGGEQPAASFMLAALNAGKCVITANKMALSLHWHELHEAAKQNNVRLCYEASVCGAIPVIRTIKSAMTSGRITKICGIVNGTTNYILTQMRENGLAYSAALEQAQQLGLAEPDPTSDVEGYDAAYKLCILSALCFRTYAHPESIHRCGISGVDIADISIGSQLGLSMKLIARAEKRDGKVFARVSPAFVSADNQLYHVNGSFNAVLMHNHASDDIFLYGRGAGAYPTASAIVADMIACVNSFADTEAADAQMELLEKPSVCSYYIRLPKACTPECCTCAYEAFGKDAFEMHHIVTDSGEYDVLLTKEISENQLEKFSNAVYVTTSQSVVAWPVEASV